MATDRTDRFIDALHRLEVDGELEPMVSLYDERAELTNPVQQEVGPEGALRLWDQHRRLLAGIRSEIRRVHETEHSAVLEWTCRGTCRMHEPVAFAGASILEFGTDNRIIAFRAYFDQEQIRHHQHLETALIV